MPDDNPPVPNTEDSPRTQHLSGPGRTVLTEKTMNSVGGLLPPPPLRAERPLPRVDGYDVLAEVGGGGMGVVYKALHLRLKRVVALKMLRPSAGLAGSEWDSLLRRFRTEAEALARLRHPNIVEVYDVGETPSGTPYFSLEFCSGGSLDARLKGTPLPPGEALSLLQTLARAMHAAHQGGIVHRDLKPANILLACNGDTESPAWSENAPTLRSEASASRLPDLEPKITDFGLARKLDEVGMTHSGAVFGTPSYMAPEQARGRSHEAGPAADIWALGAIFYETLTGRPPFKAATVAETLHQVMNEEPLPPRQLNPRIPRDLETICLKCLHKEPARRYGDAGALADDLGRFERGESIRARSTGTPERAWRWARRHPAVAGLLAALVLLTVGALTAITLLYRDAVAQAGQARLERDEARRQRRLAEENLGMARKAVDECFLVARDSPLLQQESMEQVRKLLFQKALPFYRSFQAQRPDDPALEHDLAEQHLRLATITAETGRKSEAVAQCRKALAIHHGLVEKYPDDVEYRFGLAGSLDALGMLLGELGEKKEARACLEEAGSTYRGLEKRRPDNPLYRYPRALSTINLGLIQHEQGLPRQALRLWQEAREMLRGLVAARPDELNYQASLASVCANLATLHGQLGQEKQALANGREALAIQRKLTHRVPGAAAFWRDLARTCLNQAGLLQDLGRSQEALAHAQEARTLSRRLVERYPEVTVYRLHLAGACNNLANQQHCLGQDRDALQSCREAAALQRELIAQHPRVPLYRRHQALTTTNEAMALHGLGRLKEALASFDRACELYRNALREEPALDELKQGLARACLQRGITLHTLGRMKEALASFREAEALRRALAARDPKALGPRGDLAEARSRVAAALAGVNRPEESIEQYRQAIGMFRELSEARAGMPWYRDEMARARLNLAVVLVRQGDKAEALEQLRQARAAEAQLVDEHPDVRAYRVELVRACISEAQFLLAEGKPGATACYQQAHRHLGLLAVAQPRALREEWAGVCFNLGNLRCGEGKTGEADALYRKARSLYSDLGEDHPTEPGHKAHLAMTYTALAALQRGQGASKEALQYFEQALNYRQRVAKALPDDPDSQNEHALALSNLAVAQSEAGRRSAAQRSYELARDIQQRLVSAHPGQPAYRQGLASTLVNLGSLLQDRDRPDDARKCYDEALALFGRLVKDHPGGEIYRFGLASVRNNLGNLQRRTGHPKDALASFRAARDLFLRLAAHAPGRAEYHCALSQVHVNLAQSFTDLGQTSEALDSYAQARDVLRRLQAGQGLVNVLTARADLLAQLEKNADALADLTDAVATAEGLLKQAEDDPQLQALTSVACARRASVLDRLGRYRDSLAGWTRALALAPAAEQTPIRVGRAIALARTGQYARAAAEADDLFHRTMSAATGYNLACAYALCAAGEARDPARPLPERDKQARGHARRAVELLDKVRSAGFFQQAGSRKLLDADKALAGLRDRDDYRRFRSSLPRSLP